MFEINGKVALITGGANGIGLCLSRELLRNGAEGVALVDVDDVNGTLAVKEFAKEFKKDSVIYIHADVSQKSQFEGAFQQTIERFKHLDIVVNNAGIVQELQWERSVSVNFLGCINGSLLAMDKYFPACFRYVEGIILNISSVFAFRPMQEMAIYSGTKAGILVFSRAISGALRSHNMKVKVLTICPGPTATAIMNISNKIMPEELVASTLESIKSPQVQTPEDAACHIVSIMKIGNNGSVWEIENNTHSEIQFPTHFVQKPGVSF